MSRALDGILSCNIRILLWMYWRYSVLHLGETRARI